VARSKVLPTLCLLFVLTLSLWAPSVSAIGQVNQRFPLIGQVHSPFTGTLSLDGPDGQGATCTYLDGVLQSAPCVVMPPVNQGSWTIAANGTGSFGLTVAFCEPVNGQTADPCALVLGGPYQTIASLDFCGASLDLCDGSFTGQFVVTSTCDASQVGCLALPASAAPEFPLGLTVLVALGLPLVFLMRRTQRR